MAKVFLTTDEENYVVANLGDAFYGSTGAEGIFINQNVAGIIVDSNTESVSFANDISEYSFQQNGNVLSVYSADGATLITRMAIGDNGATLVMNGVSHPIAMDATQTHPMSIAGKTVAVHTLTTGVDNIIGTTGADTFNATYGDGNPDTYTLESGDILNGGAGIDTLNVTTAQEASTPNDALWAHTTNFEKIAFNSVGNGAQTVVTGANFGTAFATGADVSIQTLLGAITLDMSGYTQDTVVNTTTIGAAAQTITTGTGAATVNATTLTAGAQTISGVNLNIVNATVLGAGAQTITSTSTSDVTVVADAFNGAQTITTGAGNDTVITSSAAGTINFITTGAGNDIIIASAGSDVITGGQGVDIMSGGTGADTFNIGAGDTGLTLATADIITDFTSNDVINATSMVGGATIVNGAGFGNFADFIAAANAAYTVNSAAYIAYNAASSGDAWVFMDHDNSDSVTTGDSIVVLNGINTAAKIDVVAPRIVSASVSIDGRSIVITHSEVLSGTPNASDYGVTLSNGTTTVTGATLGSGVDSHIVTIALTNPIAAGISVTNLVHTSSNALNDTSIVPYSLPTQTLTSVVNSSLVSDYTFTMGTDNMSGTAANDTFNATYGNASTLKTIQPEDIINGGGGIDTVNIVTGSEASTPPDGLWTNKINLEKVTFKSTGDGVQTITTGSDFEAAFATGVDLSVETQVGAINLTMDLYTKDATITTATMGAGVHTILTGSGETTVNATSYAAGAQTINGAGLTTVNALIVGAGVQTIGTTAGENIVSVNATIEGAGAQQITSTSGLDVTIVANAHNGVQTIVTSSGDDHVTTTGASGVNNTISTMEGDDIIIAGAGNDMITGGTGRDIMTGGAGRDIFVFATGDTGTTLETADIITDFSSEDIIQAPTGSLIITNGSALADFTAFTANATTALTAGAGYIAYNAAGSGDAWAIIDSNNNGILDATDAIVVLKGVNLASKIADVVAPMILAAEVAIDGRSIVITHSEALIGTPEFGDYGVTLSAGTTTITGAILGTGANAHTVTITLSDTIASTLSVTNLVYTSSTDSIQDTSIVSNKLATQTLASVNNNSSVAAHYKLTTATDTMTGTDSADAFDGTYGVGVASTYTLGVLDVLDGGNGIDTLNVTTGAEANSPTDALWANKINFEKIAFNSTSVGAQTIVTGTNFATAFATGVDMSVETFEGAITIDMTGYTQATTVNTTTIGTGAHTITTGTGEATVNATSLTDGAQTISGVNLVTVNAEVLGAGAQTITSTSTSDVTVVADAFNGAQTITTGGGNDHVTTTSAAGTINAITTGAGDDVIVAGAGSDVITGGAGRDIMTGGDGADTFAFGLADTGFTLETADIITDFSTQFDVITTEFTEGTVAIADGSFLADFEAFKVAAATALTGATSAYIAYNAANSGDAWVLSDTNNNNVVDSGDTLIILTGINLSSEIAIGDIA